MGRVGGDEDAGAEVGAGGGAKHQFLRRSDGVIGGDLYDARLDACAFDALFDFARPEVGDAVGGDGIHPLEHGLIEVVRHVEVAARGADYVDAAAFGDGLDESHVPVQVHRRAVYDGVYALLAGLGEKVYGCLFNALAIRHLRVGEAEAGGARGYVLVGQGES